MRKKQLRLKCRLATQWAKMRLDGRNPMRGEQHGFTLGYAYSDGRFEGTHLALSAMSDPLNRSQYKTPAERRMLVNLWRKWRTEPKMRHLDLHPRLP